MTELRVAERFAAAIGEANVLQSEPMSSHTTFRIGGPADYFLTPGSSEEVRELLSICAEAGIPYFIAGNGSNLLVSDDGYRGAVIRIGKNMSAIRIQGTCLRAEAGALLSTIAAAAQEASLTGLEFAGGIPGTLGGACVMNAGAYDGEMKQVLRSVTVLTESGTVETVPAETLELGYRTSLFQKRPLIALAAEMELTEGNPEEIAAKMADFRERRQSKQPLELPSAGSTFKRPPGNFAGKLIMEAGLRGYQVGGAQVSEKHCGFVVNRGGATAADVCALMKDVQRIVREHSGVSIEPEVRFLGF